MYAIIKNGGQQYKVAEGDLLQVAKIEADQGTSVELDNVLLLSDGQSITVGTPYVEGAKVKAEIVRHGRAKKITIIKFRRRKHYMKKQGHRQDFTEIKVTQVHKG